MELNIVSARQYASGVEVIENSGIVKFGKSVKFAVLAAKIKKDISAAIGAEEEAIQKKAEPVVAEIRTYLEKEDFVGDTLQHELNRRLQGSQAYKSISEELGELYKKTITVEDGAIVLTEADIVENREPVPVTIAGESKAIDPYAQLRFFIKEGLIIYND